MAPIDTFFEVVAVEVTQVLESRPMPLDRRHWIVLQDQVGVEISEVTEGEVVVHRVLDSLVAGGAIAAAYVTYLPSPDARVLAQVLTDEPRDSDVRVASLQETSANQLVLGPWVRTV